MASNHSEPITPEPRSFALPFELLDAICNQLSCQDIKNWSFVCRHFYFKLLPVLHHRDSKQDQQHRAAPWACRYGQLNVLASALNAGTDVNHKFPRLVRDGHHGTVYIRDVRRPPESFPTLLHIATYYDQIDAIKFLISHGADTKADGSWFEPLGCPKSIFFARSPEAVDLLIPSVSSEDSTFFISFMIEEWASSSTIETALAHIGSIDPQDAGILLETACKYHRIDIFDLLVRHLRIGRDPDQELYPYFMINVALMPLALPMSESISQIIDRVSALPIKKSLSVYIDQPMINFRNLLSYNLYSRISLLQLSMEPWVPVSATARLLQLGADPHVRRSWPSSDLFFPLYYRRRWPTVAPPILGTRWQKSGTALGYALALTLMDNTSHYQRDNRQKAHLLLEHGAGFETTGYPVSFILTTVTWPFTTRTKMDRIQSLCGDIMLQQRNKYGETHLSSLLSWLSHGQSEKGKYGTKRPIEVFASDIACLVHVLLQTDKANTYLTTAATGGPSKGLLPIEIICRYPVPKIYKNRRKYQHSYHQRVLEIIDVLLRHGSCVDTKDADGQSLLHWAAKAGDVDQVRFLLERGAEVGNIDNFGFTALHFACQMNVEDIDPEQGQRRVSIIRHLLRNGADLNATTNEGITPLFLACQTLSTEIVTELLSLGAVTLESNDGMSPRDAVNLAESQYIDYHLGELGAMSHILFELGDTDYVYDPRESVLSILDSPPEYVPMEYDLEDMMSVWNVMATWDFFTDDDIDEKCNTVRYQSEFREWEGTYGYRFFILH
ncbi:ankyrin [Hypoxylon sp. FL1857]|nr:ankyrin [Hypoxylon sp. FL1857]